MTLDMTNSTDKRTGGPGSAKRSKKKKGADVIHVAFGNGGGRIPPPPPGAGANGANKGAARDDAPTDGREPVSDVYTRREVAKLLNVTEAQLKSLDRSAIVSPSGERGK